MAGMFNFAMDNRAKPKIYIPVGCLMDIPTASIISGAKGETLYNGGLGQVVGVVGAGNNFKSTLIHYMTLSAASKIAEATKTYILTYDTEVNISFDRLEHFAAQFPSLGEGTIQGNDPIWTIMDKSSLPANEWGDKLFEYMEEKQKDKKDYVTIECILDPYTHKPMSIPRPTFVEIDSFTEFEAASVAEMLSGDLDSKDTNTYAMKQGNFKTKFLSQLPGRCPASSTYITLTAHTGDKVNMGMQPWEEPSKKLQFLKTGDSIKSVGSKFSFLTNIAYQAHTGSLFYNQGTKGPEYPKDPNDVTKADLNKVTLTTLRSKSGPSGGNIEVLISQSEGVLPSLTEFHFLRQNKSGTPGFGITGSDRSYALDIYPEVSLSRTTVRSKLDTDPKLRRAVNITAELLQLATYHRMVIDSGLMCTPAELYEDIKKLGYDWDILLDTRGYWTLNQYSHPVPYLNTVDLLKMRKELYRPWWYDAKVKELSKTSENTNTKKKEK